ncbi:Ephrin-B2a [Blomia tropicalis]|nr:Ephrin-B2a [Blomia tropicalis]
MVSKEEYDSCHIGNKAVARTIAVCDKPNLNRYFTITFRPFTPQPGGLEFRPGQDYYFIALPASDNDPNPSRPCQKYHMKVVFKVCCKRPHQPTIGKGTNRSSIIPPVRIPLIPNQSRPSSSNPTIPSFPNINNNNRDREKPMMMNIPSITQHDRPGLGFRHQHGSADPTNPYDIGSKPYWKNGQMPSPFPKAYHPYHPSQLTSTTTPDPLWKPHHGSVSTSRDRYPYNYHNSKKGRYPLYPQNDIREKSDGLNSASYGLHRLTWWTILLSIMTIATNTFVWSYVTRLYILW